MSGNENIDDRIERLAGWYGEGADGSAPTHDQWRALLQRPSDAPITLINFFKLRARAVYLEGGPQEAASGPPSSATPK